MAATTPSTDVGDWIESPTSSPGRPYQQWRAFDTLTKAPIAIVHGHPAMGFDWWIYPREGEAPMMPRERGWKADERGARNGALAALRVRGLTTPPDEPEPDAPEPTVKIGSIVVGAYTERGGRAIRGFVIGRPFGDHEPDEWIVYWPVRDGGIGESLEREHEIRLVAGVAL